jgi:predicted ferric reductase
MRSIRSAALVGFFLITCLFLIGITPLQASEESHPDISGGDRNINIATAWKNISTDEHACLNRSKTALQNTGFQHIHINNESVSGDLDQYTGTVRCAAHEKIAFFVVAGTNTDTAFRRVSEIYDNF